MRIPRLALFILFLAVIHSAHAGTGVFSSDGGTVYLANGQLGVLDLDKPDHIDRLTTPSQIGENIMAVTRAGDSILCLSQHHVASFNPKTREWKKITDAAGDVKFLNMAYDSTRDMLVITKYPTTYQFYDGCPVNLVCLNLKDTSQTTVRSRGVGFARGPAFDSRGHFFFSWLGDMWQGQIEMKDGEAWLVGSRAAALARPETAIASMYGWGIFEIAPAGTKLYFHNKQRGGTTFGAIMSIDSPAAARRDGAPYGREAKLLSSVKVVNDTATATPFLCASPDGTKVFFIADNKCWLVEDRNKPRELPVKFERMRQ
ncbi:hypothetical protein LLG95_13885 [bacterium]|nr:hypothetical protein [bacterium]